MSTLCCTRKLLDEVRIKRPEPHAPSSSNLLGDWHANFIRIERRKAVIFVNDRTLLSFVMIGVSRDQMRDLGGLFRPGLRGMLALESLNAELIEQLLVEYESVAISATHDRSVVGVMNDLVHHYKWMVEDAGGLALSNIPHFIRVNNRMPQLSRPIHYAIEALNVILHELQPRVRIPVHSRHVIDAIKSKLADNAAAEVVLTYEQVCPPFYSIPEFIHECDEEGLECIIPPIVGPGVRPMRMHVRLRSMFTALSLVLPSKT